MNDIIFTLLIDALVISHLCQNAGIAYSAVDTADACMLTVGIPYKFRTVGGIPCLPRCSQGRSIRITGTHKGCNRSNKCFAQFFGACLLKGIGIFGIAVALIRQEGLEDAMHRYAPYIHCRQRQQYEQKQSCRHTYLPYNTDTKPQQTAGR